MSTSWPSILPNPEVDLSGELENSTTRTKMQSGRYRQNALYTRENRTYPVSWMFSDYEFGMFQSWFKYKLGGGSAFFDIPEWPTGGEGFKEIQGRFVGGRYRWRHVGVLYWSVSAVIEVEDAKVWDEDVYDMLILLGDPTALEQAALSLHILVNETLPNNL